MIVDDNDDDEERDGMDEKWIEIVVGCGCCLVMDIFQQLYDKNDDKKNEIIIIWTWNKKKK